MNDNSGNNIIDNSGNNIIDKATGMATGVAQDFAQAAVGNQVKIANNAVEAANGTVTKLADGALYGMSALTKALNNVKEINGKIEESSKKLNSTINGKQQNNGGAKKLNKVAVLMKNAAEKLPSLSDISNKSLKNKVKTAKKKLLKASHKAKQASKKIMKLIKGGRRRSSSSRRR